MGAHYEAYRIVSMPRMAATCGFWRLQENWNQVGRETFYVLVERISTWTVKFQLQKQNYSSKRLDWRSSTYQRDPQKWPLQVGIVKTTSKNAQLSLDDWTILVFHPDFLKNWEMSIPKILSQNSGYIHETNPIKTTQTFECLVSVQGTSLASAPGIALEEAPIAAHPGAQGIHFKAGGADGQTAGALGDAIAILSWLVTWAAINVAVFAVCRCWVVELSKLATVSWFSQNSQNLVHRKKRDLVFFDGSNWQVFKRNDMDQLMQQFDEG